MGTGPKVFVTEPCSFVGSAIAGALERKGFSNICGKDGKGPDLRDRIEVDSFFERERPECVFLAAGRAAGIGGNIGRPGELMLDNMLVACHVMDSARRHGVRRLLYLASSCCYPKDCPQPMRESSLWTGPLEPTSAPYATAKLAGLALCSALRAQFGVDFVAAIPADAFGPGDDFEPDGSHVVAGLMSRFHRARMEGRTTVDVWGSGRPLRDFLFVEDLAEACVLLAEHCEESGPVNIGSGRGVSIRELAETVRDVVCPGAALRFDTGRPDGAPSKVLDTTRIRALGWAPRAELKGSLALTYRWYAQSADVRGTGRGGAG